MAVSYDSSINNTIIDEVVSVLEACAEEIKAEMQSKGINASGRTSNAIKVERYEGGVRLVIEAGNVAPLGTLEVGRAGGRVPFMFSTIIQQWAKDKGLSFATEGDLKRFAFLTSRKIASRGTERHASPTDVYSAAVMRAKDKIKDSIKMTLTDYIHENLG